MNRSLLGLIVLLSLFNQAQASNNALIVISDIRFTAISGNDYQGYEQTYGYGGAGTESLDGAGNYYDLMTDGSPTTDPSIVTSDGGGNAHTYLNIDYLSNSAESYAEAANANTNLGGSAWAYSYLWGYFEVGENTTVALSYDVFGFVTSEVGSPDDIASISYGLGVLKLNTETKEWDPVSGYDYSLDSTSFGNQSNQINETVTPLTFASPGWYTIGFNINAYAHKSPTLIAQPVPEPSNLAMLLGGLGLIGIFRRFR